MSLEGNLSAFGISEILQLIAVQQKSGMLSVSTQDRSMVLFFREGQLISNRDRRRKTKDPFKDYVIRYGILSRESLMRATQISTQSKLDLTDIIVSEGFMSEDEIKLHFRNQIQEAVYEILTWERCSYKFIPGNDIISGIKSFGEYGVEGVLMESMRRIDEFPRMLKDFPSEQDRIKKTKDPKSGDELTSAEGAILKLIAREKKLGFIIANAKLPKFDTYEALKLLLEKKLIEVIHTKEADEDVEKAVKKRRQRIRKPRKNPLPLALVFAAFVAAGAYGAKGFIGRASTSSSTGIPAGLSIANNRVEAMLHWRLEAYRAHFGHYPSRLSELSERGFASERLINEAESHSLRYRLTEDKNGYTLR